MSIDWMICFVLATTDVGRDGIGFSLDALRQMAIDALGHVFPIIEGTVVMITETSLDEKDGILYGVTQRVDNNKG